MFLYTIFAAIAGIITGILLAACTKKAEGVTYGVFDKIGKIFNIVLIPIYAVSTPLYMFISMLCEPNFESPFGILGLIVSCFIGAAPFFAALGLGVSAVLRKKGKSKLSFVIQFLGAFCMICAFILFCVCYGSLFPHIN